jgi:hypothetical protein
MPLTTVSPGLLDSNAQYNSFKNRLINGAMMIDQRNAGASVSVNADSIFYPVDRFLAAGENADGVFSAQQDSTAPAGFTKSLKLTVTTTDASLGASQRYLFGQSIEGLNVADLGWGTASASTVTLSFWVRSSVTGTFSGSLANSSYNRCYPFSYTINSADTFEYKTVTIAGDTTGTWLTTNGVGIRAWFTIGAGSSNLGTAGAWGSTYYFGATGQTNLMATSGATFYITGVQLEKGSTATSFDYRPYGTELQLCQRYYYRWTSASAAYARYAVGSYYGPSACNVTQKLPVTMRSTPTLADFSAASTFRSVNALAISTVTSYSLANESSVDTVALDFTSSTGTSGQAGWISANNTTSAFLGFSSEL